MDLSNKQNMLDLTWRQPERRAGPADFDPTQDTRDYEQVAQSARAYQTLTGNLLRQETIHCEGFVTHEDTEAPPPPRSNQGHASCQARGRGGSRAWKKLAPPPPFFFFCLLHEADDARVLQLAALGLGLGLGLWATANG